MKNPNISVIVPIYNSEKFISKCVDSFLAQTYFDFELLLINDGSTDNSGRICDEYALKDNRIRIFHKENGGVSSARNVGIKNAKGKWIWFVDSDDSVQSQTLDSLSQYFEDNIDCIMFGFKKLNAQNQIIYEYTGGRKNILLNNEESIKCLYSSLFYPYQGYIWSKLFRKELISKESILFDEQIFFNEDRLFCLKYFAVMQNKTFYTTTPYYYYYDNDSSAMANLKRQYNSKFITDLDAFIKMQSIIKGKKICNLYKYARWGIVRSVFNNLFLLKKYSIVDSEKETKLISLLKKNFRVRDFLLFIKRNEIKILLYILYFTLFEKCKF
jgi:glycosyltransferase involved in cell wall biosynthesis